MTFTWHNLFYRIYTCSCQQTMSIDLYSCVPYFCKSKVSKGDSNLTYLSYHLWLVRLAIQDTFTALSQMPPCTRQTGSSSKTPNNLGHYLGRLVQAWHYQKYFFIAQKAYSTAGWQLHIQDTMAFLQMVSNQSSIIAKT